MTVYDYREITLKEDLCLDISRDTDIENPRENDFNAATFYCLKSPRRKIGDIIDSAYYLNETKRTLAKTGEYAILPIFFREHISDTPVSRCEAMSRAKDCICSELEAYSDYLQGNCWQYCITDEDGNVVDSCSGFIGDDLEKNGILNYICDYIEK